MEGRYFSASMSSGIKAITYIVGWGIGFGVPLVIGVSFMTFYHESRFLLLPLVMLVILGATYAYRPLGYRVTNDDIQIIRPVGDVVIRRSDIMNAERYDQAHHGLHGVAKMRFASVRLAGSGGFYGGYGLFWNKAWGKFYAYVTRTDTLVVIVPKEGRGRRVLVSPDEPDAFIAALQA